MRLTSNRLKDVGTHKPDKDLVMQRALKAHVPFAHAKDVWVTNVGQGMLPRVPLIKHLSYTMLGVDAIYAEGGEACWHTPPETYLEFFVPEIKGSKTTTAHLIRAMVECEAALLNNLPKARETETFVSHRTWRIERNWPSWKESSPKGYKGFMLVSLIHFAPHEVLQAHIDAHRTPEKEEELA